jgi:hypothetical protein
MQVVLGIRCHFEPGSGRGTPLKAGQQVQIGCLPAGAFVMGVQAAVPVAYGGVATLDIGTAAAPTGFAAAIDLNAVANSQGAGTLLGYVADETPVFARLNTALAAGAGAIADVLLHFYANRD